jgi:hypothetical protein
MPSNQLQCSYYLLQAARCLQINCNALIICYKLQDAFPDLKSYMIQLSDHSVENNGFCSDDLSGMLLSALVLLSILFALNCGHGRSLSFDPDCFVVMKIHFL